MAKGRESGERGLTTLKPWIKHSSRTRDMLGFCLNSASMIDLSVRWKEMNINQVVIKKD